MNRRGLRDTVLIPPLLVVLFTAVLAACGESNDTPGGGSKDGGGVDVKRVGIGEEDKPSSLVAGKDALWIGIDGKLLEADPLSGRIRRRIEVPVAGSPTHMAVDDETVWLVVFTEAEEQLVGVDIESGKVKRKPFKIPFQFPIEIVATKGFVWLSSNLKTKRDLYRYDPKAGRFTKRIPGVGNKALAGGEDGLWMTSDDGLVKVDPASARVVGGPFELPPKTNPVAVGEGVVWTATFTGDVTRYDPESGKQIGKRTGVARHLDDIAAGPLGTWVADFFSDRIIRLDPKTGRPSLTEKGVKTQDVAVGDRAVYGSGEDPADQFKGGLYIITPKE